LLSYRHRLLNLPDTWRRKQRWDSVRQSVGPALIGLAGKNTLYVGLHESLTVVIQYIFQAKYDARLCNPCLMYTAHCKEYYTISKLVSARKCVKCVRKALGSTVSKYTQN